MESSNQIVRAGNADARPLFASGGSLKRRRTRISIGPTPTVHSRPRGLWILVKLDDSSNSETGAERISVRIGPVYRRDATTSGTSPCKLSKGKQYAVLRYGECRRSAGGCDTRLSEKPAGMNRVEVLGPSQCDEFSIVSPRPSIVPPH